MDYHIYTTHIHHICVVISCNAYSPCSSRCMQVLNKAAHPGLLQISSTYKGYSCDSNVLTGSSIYVLIVALTTIALIKVAPKLNEKLASQIESSNQSYKVYSFFWASSFVASVCNVALLLFESIFFLGYIFSPSYWIIKVPMMFFLILLDILVAICIPKTAEFPIPYLAYILSFPLCCTCCCCSCCRRSKQLRSKWIQTLALTSLLLFTQFIALSSLPTILWAFACISCSNIVSEHLVCCRHILCDCFNSCTTQKYWTNCM